MRTGKGNRTNFARLLGAGLDMVVAASLLGGMLVALSACGGGSPMTVEQRYSAPKTPDEILQDRVDAARRAERAHGSL
jgi:hypothetical protein